jgi:hypothetical protein
VSSAQREQKKRGEKKKREKKQKRQQTVEINQHLLAHMCASHEEHTYTTHRARTALRRVWCTIVEWTLTRSKNELFVEQGRNEWHEQKARFELSEQRITATPAREQRHAKTSGSVATRYECVGAAVL